MELLLETLTRFWEDPTSLAALISALAAILGIFVSSHFSPYRRKALTYRVVSDTSITEMNKGQGKGIVISFTGEQPKDLRLVVLTIRNSGNIPITPKDYEEPIQISFRGGEVLESRLLQRGETEAAQTLNKTAPDSVILPPLLLKPKDLITVTTILTGFSGAINIATRLANSEFIVANNALS